MIVSDIEAELVKFNDFMQLYGNSTYGKLRKRTRQKHTTLTRVFLKTVKGEVTKESIGNYLRPYIDFPFKWNNRLKALRVYVRDFRKEAYLLEGLDLQDEPERVKTATKPTQVITFFKAIREDDFKLQSLFMLLASSGLRLN